MNIIYARYSVCSDIHHLFNTKPYGCARYLWLDKRGEEPDYPILAEGAIKRGNKMESLIVDEYMEETGNKVRIVTKTLKHKDYKWAAVHLDGEIVGHKKGPGVLECKSVGRNMFLHIVQEGIPSSWLLQMQHGMFVAKRTWASIAVLWAENWEFITFDIERDDEIIDSIIKQGEIFWKQVEYGPAPERLDPSDKRCKRCAYRTTCQGEALLQSVVDDGTIDYDDDLSPIVASLVELESVADETKQLIDEKKKQIKELIGDRPVVDCAGYRLHYKPIETRRINTRKLKSEAPDIYEKYATTSVSRPFKKTAK